ncbi:MAG TPA: CSLREA domain-containing protein, partial [Tichowtungia sp.]|nr:CSLREA domain-containing protein [Tichowtungia sp.]
VVTTLDDTVDLTDGDISLREAIYYTRFSGLNSNTVTFAQSLAGGTNLLNGTELSLGGNLTIRGPEAGIALDAQGSNRVVLISSFCGGTPDVTLENLTLQNGWAVNGAGLYVRDGDANLASLKLLDNAVEQNGYGAGLCVGGLATASVIDSELRRNTPVSGAAGVNGGGIHNTGTLTMDRCLITDSSAKHGSGIFNNSSGVLTIRDSELSGNFKSEYYSYGAALYTQGSADLINVLVRNNSTRDGIIYQSGSNPFRMVNVEVTGNTSTYRTFQGTSTNSILINVTLADNNTGSYPVFDDPVTLVNSIVYNNSGPAFDANDANVFVNCLIDTDPGFLDPVGGDYSLRTDSVAVDAGTTNGYSSEVTTDLAGNPRLVGVRPDLGAYEQQTGYTGEARSSTVTSLADEINGTNGVVSLREAITYAQSVGEPVTFDPSLSGQTIQLSGELLLNGELAIQGGGVTLDAGGTHRVVRIDGSSSDITLENLTLTGGLVADEGGGIYLRDGLLTLRDCTVVSNEATGYNDGGAIYVYYGELHMESTDVIDNTGDEGGGLYLYYSDAVISNCTF